MTTPVSLQAIVTELEALPDGIFSYLNTQTGELIAVMAEDLRMVQREVSTDNHPEWYQAVLAQARAILDSDDYLELPTSQDIDEYAIMEDFCHDVKDPDLRKLLLDQIRGSGAFRRFKQTIRQYGIAEEWYSFHAAEVEAIAVEWLEAHQIPYQRDTA